MACLHDVHPLCLAEELADILSKSRLGLGSMFAGPGRSGTGADPWPSRTVA